MGKRDESNTKKECFLRKMLELKGQLFGAFSPIITKDSKRKAWAELRDYAVSIAFISKEKDAAYVRDATWPNIRKKTMVKVDNSSKTGTGGGTDAKLNKIDHLVLEIIDRKSPILQGCGVPDSMGITSSCVILDANLPVMDMSNEQSRDLEEEAITPTVRIPVKRKVIVKNQEEQNQIESLKKRKLQFEVRKLQLEVWEKEKVLSIKHSEFTSSIEEL